MASPHLVVYDAFVNDANDVVYRAVRVNTREQDETLSIYGVLDHWIYSNVEEWTPGATYGETDIADASEIVLGTGHSLALTPPFSPFPLKPASTRVILNQTTILLEGQDYRVINTFDPENPLDLNAFATESKLEFFTGDQARRFTTSDHVLIEYDFIDETAVVGMYTEPNTLRSTAVVLRGKLIHEVAVLRRGAPSNNLGNFYIAGFPVAIPDIIVPDVLPFSGIDECDPEHMAYNTQTCLVLQIVEAINLRSLVTGVTAFDMGNGRLGLIANISNELFEISDGTYPITKFGFYESYRHTQGLLYIAWNTVGDITDFSFKTHRRATQRTQYAEGLIGQAVSGETDAIFPQTTGFSGRLWINVHYTSFSALVRVNCKLYEFSGRMQIIW